MKTAILFWKNWWHFLSLIAFVGLIFLGIQLGTGSLFPEDFSVMDSIKIDNWDKAFWIGFFCILLVAGIACAFIWGPWKKEGK